MIKIYNEIRLISPLNTYNRSGEARHHLFQCHCGNFFVSQLPNVKNGNTKSCGCLFKTCNIKHGFAKDGIIRGELHSYYSAKKRCTNPNSQDWPDYGGRGIEFRFNSAVEFIEYLGERPHPKMSLDRINPDGHYEKGNVRWANAYTQQHNKRKKVGA